MTPGTAPLIDRQRDEVEAAADAATVARLERDLIAVQKERIAELEAEVAELKDAYGQRYDQVESLAAENRWLRAVAQRGAALTYYRSGHDVIVAEGLWDPFEEALDALCWMPLATWQTGRRRGCSRERPTSL